MQNVGKLNLFVYAVLAVSIFRLPTHLLTERGDNPNGVPCRTSSVPLLYARHDSELHELAVNEDPIEERFKTT